MKTLYVSDLDGTLLTPEHRISPYSLAVLNRLTERGMPFTYATARSIHSAVLVTEGLRVRLPVIVHNGVFITNPASGRALSSLTFQPEEVALARAVLAEQGVLPLVYSSFDDGHRVFWHPDCLNEGMQFYLNNRKGDKRFRQVSFPEELYAGNVFYFTCIGERERLFPVYEILSRDARFRCTLQQELYREEYWLEVMPAAASKANALRRLKEMLGCERVVCFGDAINDLPLFEESDECYAVANAVPELKRMATAVIGGNRQDGVARFLLERFGAENAGM